MSRDSLSAPVRADHKVHICHQLVIKHDCVSGDRKLKAKQIYLFFFFKHTVVSVHSCTLIRNGSHTRLVLCVPLSDGGIKALPVAALHSVVVADVLLLVLLHRRSRGCYRGQLLSSINLGGHFITPEGYSVWTHGQAVPRCGDN